ncbi:hypothetical protein L596_015656 [Steinernema carpocapsae]|nr:hypothetical protein L596_015656 [Steinernema carpocapsae]
MPRSRIICPTACNSSSHSRTSRGLQGEDQPLKCIRRFRNNSFFPDAIGHDCLPTTSPHFDSFRLSQSVDFSLSEQMKQRFKRSDGQDHAYNNSSLLLGESGGGATRTTMTRAHRHQRPIEGPGFYYTSNFPAATLMFMVISFMIVTLLILGLCGASVFFVRHLTKRKGRRELQEYRNAHPPPARSTKEFDFVLDMRLQSMEKLIPQIPQGKKPTKIDAGPKDVAGIVGFLATHKVRDEALEFRSPNTEVVLVPRTYQSAEPVVAPNPFMSSVRAAKAIYPMAPVVAPFAPIPELRISESNDKILRDNPEKVVKKKRKSKKPKRG